MGKNLKMKAARAALGLTQQDLAEAVGVTRQTIVAIERGDYNPTIKLCVEICKALCKAFGVAWAQGPWEAILLIWGSVALCWWEFILRDINPMGRSQKTFFFAMGLCGLSMVVMELASLAAGRGPLLEEGMLTSAGAITLTGCLMASILAVYLAKSFREKRRPAGDQD